MVNDTSHLIGVIDIASHFKDINIFSWLMMSVCLIIGLLMTFKGYHFSPSFCPLSPLIPPNYFDLGLYID